MTFATRGLGEFDLAGLNANKPPLFDPVAKGLEAFAAHSRSKHELILMDCQRPEMDGWEATRLIRQNEQYSKRRAAMLSLTAVVPEDDRERSIEADMDDSLTTLMETAGKEFDC